MVPIKKNQLGLAHYSLGLNCFIYQIKKLQICVLFDSLFIRGKLQQFLGDKCAFRFLNSAQRLSFDF